MKKIILITAVLGLLGGSSCNTDFLDLPNPSAYSADTYFDGASAATYKGVTTAIYSGLMHQGLFARDWYFYLDMLGNEVEPTNAMLGENRVMCNYSFQPDNGYLTLLWRYLYQVQHRANFAISVLNAWNPEKTEEQTQKSYFVGEARFFQGFIYYHLAALYGAVPLYRTYEEVLENQMQARSPRATIYQYAEDMLKEAITLLPGRWPSNDNGRATLWAAKAYLAQLYMQSGRYSEAIPILEDIIAN
ncbi:MAG: RagB/SusD family nutrient uptake outer membrane protein, partial [Bacteroidales bacterium]|nr:RagB/SusD family nutrient uptake outer membrane protein [Bacteroidales bacterium]